MSRIVFLDFDGVVRLRGEDRESTFRAGPMQLLAGCCVASDARIVVTSDYGRKLGLERVRAELAAGLLSERLHEDWCTDRLGVRWQEILRWLCRHPEVESFAIVDDMAALYDTAPQDIRARLVLCSNRFGFVKKLCLPLVTFLHGSGLTKPVDGSNQVAQ